MRADNLVDLMDIVKPEIVALVAANALIDQGYVASNYTIAQQLQTALEDYLVYRGKSDKPAITQLLLRANARLTALLEQEIQAKERELDQLNKELGDLEEQMALLG